MNYNKAFYENFNIDPEAYEDISITTLPFSVRVISRLKKTGIFTVADLVKSTPSELMKLNGFGKSCLDEVLDFCRETSNSTIINEKTQKINRIYIPPSFSKYCNEIITGSFSAIDENKLLDDEVLLLQQYKEAYEVLGPDLVFDCVNSPKEITPIMHMLEDYQNQFQRYLKLKDLADALPGDRKYNKALGYINAFTLNENDRSLLYNICKSDDCSILSMIEVADTSNPTICILLKRFLEWCSFDIKKEIDELFATLYSDERDCLMIQMRSRKHTLEQVGVKLGVTRERVRQREIKAKRVFSRLQSQIRIISKISAERNGDLVLTSAEMKEFCSDNTTELMYFLQSYENANYVYDRDLDVFILGDDSIRGRIQDYLESLPDIVNVGQLDSLVFEAAEEADIPREMLEKAFFDTYRMTGDVYHRNRLSLASIYERVLDMHYPDGFKVYDSDEIKKFREIIANEYGDVGLPQNDRALTARVASVCMLCGRGTYRLKKKEYLPKALANKICEYIENNENTIFLTNTLFSVFEEELVAAGVDNKYFLQGVLRELFGDRFVFYRDYISKDADITSVHSCVEEFIKKYDYPVSKAQIQEAFPGITEIVINGAVGTPSILNFLGEYLHASKLNILDSEKEYLLETVENLVGDNESHHIRELYDLISRERPEILTRNAVLYPFGTFSIVEYLFRDKFQFSRPYLAKTGVEIGRFAERLHDLIYSSDEFTVSEISEFGRDNHLHIYSLLEYVNGCNDEFLLINDDTMKRIDRTGIDEVVARQVEDIISESICETTPVKNLSIWTDLPAIKVPWTEWLIYSVILKWGTKLVVATSSNQFRLSVPLVAPVDNYDPSAFKDVDKGDSSDSFVADDLSDMDSLLEDIIEDDFLNDI